MLETLVQIKILDQELYAAKDAEKRTLVTKEGTYAGFVAPRYATKGAAAVDLIAADNVFVRPGEVVAIKTGIAISIMNDAVCAMILPRSGLGTKGLVMANTVGLIDSDYQGELVIMAMNRLAPLDRSGILNTSFEIRRGERIAQMVFIPVHRALWELVDEFAITTERGEAGFGSTGA